MFDRKASSPKNLLEVELDKVEWDWFTGNLYLCRFSKWEKEYCSENVSEGKRWNLEVSFLDREKMVFSGNTPPPNWDKLIYAMNEIQKRLKKKIRKNEKCR
jgi:hypothetical protein